MAKMRVLRIPPRINLLKVVAAVLKPVTDRMELVKDTQEGKRNWLGQAVNIWIQVKPDALPEISESLAIGGERLNILVEGRKPQCFSCGDVGHIK